jgi:hypothetical protein
MQARRMRRTTGRLLRQPLAAELRRSADSKALLRDSRVPTGGSHLVRRRFRDDHVDRSAPHETLPIRPTGIAIESFGVAVPLSALRGRA